MVRILPVLVYSQLTPKEVPANVTSINNGTLLSVDRSPVLTEKSYFYFTPEEYKKCLTCLTSGEVYYIYPNKIHSNLATGCALERDIARNNTISVIYGAIFQLHECKYTHAMKLHFRSQIYDLRK